MEKACAACGMPLPETEAKEVCHFCEGQGCEEVFHGGAKFFLSFCEGDQALAERVTRYNMRRLPYGRGQWKDEACLVGEEASEAEWNAALQKLQAAHAP